MRPPAENGRFAGFFFLMDHTSIVRCAQHAMTFHDPLWRKQVEIALANYNEAHQMSLDLNQPADVRREWQEKAVECRRKLFSMI